MSGTGSLTHNNLMSLSRFNSNKNVSSTTYLKRHSNNTYHGREINVYSMQTLFIFGRSTKAAGGEEKRLDRLEVSVNQMLLQRAYTQTPNPTLRID